MATKIKDLSKSDVGIEKTISQYSNLSNIEIQKNSFFSFITQSEYGERPEYEPSMTQNYLGGLIIGKEDLLNILSDESCHALHVSFGIKSINSKIETHLFFQKILDNGGEFLELGNDVFSTDPDGGNSPDPVLHCPGPKCNP